MFRLQVIPRFISNTGISYMYHVLDDELYLYLHYWDFRMNLLEKAVLLLPQHNQMQEINTSPQKNSRTNFLES